MTAKKIYGLPSIDMGDWVRGYDQRTGRYIENSKTGFRVYIQHPNQRIERQIRYILCKDGFCMGLALLNDGGYKHVDNPQTEVPYIIIGDLGGKYYTVTAYEDEGFVCLADTEYFENKAQQNAYIEALKDAVPRMPIRGECWRKFNGGFGYQVEFTKEVLDKINSGGFITHSPSNL